MKQIYLRSHESCHIKGTEESLTHHDLSDFGLICSVKKCKICFGI